MNNSEQINEFLEGNLDNGSEQSLFAELSANEELRTEFKESIFIDKAFNKKLSAFVPSAATTMGLFNKIGVVAPAAITGAAISGNFFSVFFRKFGQGLLGLGIGLILATAYFIGSGGSKTNEEAAFAEFDRQPPATKSEVFVTSLKNNDFEKPVRSQTAPLVSSVGKSRPEKSNDLNEFDMAQKESFPDRNIALLVSPVDKISNSSVSSIYTGSNFYPYKVEQVPLQESEFSEPAGIEIELRGSQYWNFNDHGMTPSDIPEFNNMGIAFYYRFSDALALGLDFRQENFYQEFEGSEFGTEYQYRMYPNYLTVAATLRGTLLRFNNLSMFGQFSAGATYTGGIGRTMIGLEYAPSDAYSFLLGLEGSGLIYQYGDEYYISPKLGLNYSVLFRF